MIHVDFRHLKQVSWYNGDAGHKYIYIEIGKDKKNAIDRANDAQTIYPDLKSKKVQRKMT